MHRQPDYSNSRSVYMKAQNALNFLADTVSPKGYLALGDSYTIGESVNGSERFPNQLSRMLQSAGFDLGEPRIVALTGWTTGDLIAAIRRESAFSTYELVTVLIGVNNQYQGRGLDEYEQDFRQILEMAIRFAGGRPSRVLVLSIPDYSVTPFASQMDGVSIARQIDAFNKVSQRLSQQAGLRYLDITPESRKAHGDPSLMADDGLHYSAKEYRIWALALAALVKEQHTKSK